MGADWFYLAAGNGCYIFAGIVKLVGEGLKLVNLQKKTEPSPQLTGGMLGVWWLVDWIRILDSSFYGQIILRAFIFQSSLFILKNQSTILTIFSLIPSSLLILLHDLPQTVLETPFIRICRVKFLKKSVNSTFSVTKMLILLNFNLELKRALRTKY